MKYDGNSVGVIHHTKEKWQDFGNLCDLLLDAVDDINGIFSKEV